MNCPAIQAAEREVLAEPEEIVPKPRRLSAHRGIQHCREDLSRGDKARRLGGIHASCICIELGGCQDFVTGFSVRPKKLRWRID